MKKMKIKLSSLFDVREFVKIVTAFDGDVDICSGHHIVDAKSILGILAINRFNPLDVVVDREEDAEKLFPSLEKFKA